MKCMAGDGCIIIACSILHSNKKEIETEELFGNNSS